MSRDWAQTMVMHTSQIKIFIIVKKSRMAIEFERRAKSMQRFGPIGTRSGFDHRSNLFEMMMLKHEKSNDKWNSLKEEALKIEPVKSDRKKMWYESGVH